ncbi:hypothetical protein LXL04_009174 [Taraxacum kok-saghyz]
MEQISPKSNHENNSQPESESENGKKEFVSPSVGMEFESYDDAYNYYNCYARESGFRVRVKNSWFKRNSREKYGAVLCCSSQGFKRIKDVNRLRKETRTGCPAMVRMRLVDSRRWRILEVTLDHNHLLTTKSLKSLKKLGICGTKKSIQSDSETQTVKLYRALVIDSGGNHVNSRNTRELGSSSDYLPDRLNLKKGDSQAIYNYICRMQLTNPNFFYLMDVTDEGNLKNMIWLDARCRAAIGYFSDVVYFDTSYLSSKYEVPLVTFVGVNHHFQTVLLGCGLLSGGTKESFSWVLKSWLTLTTTSGQVPQTIITERCRILQNVVSEVFPKTHHRFSLSHIMKKVPEKLGGLRNYDAIKKVLIKTAYETLKPYDFETSWGFMIQRFGIGDHDWLRSLYEDRAWWAPVYLKDTVFAGIISSCDTLCPIFDKYIHKQTPLKEFLDKYELALQKKHKEEANADMESRTASPVLKTRCSYELQLSKIYTREVFKKFQVEVEEMYSCFSTTQVHVDGAVVIFLVKERVLGDGNRREIKDFEVLYNRGAVDVRCICSCFNFNGYLCRHALCVLNFNGVEEIPSKYILPRWKRDYKRLYVQDYDVGCNTGTTGTVVTDTGTDTDVVQCFNQLYRSALQVVEEGVISLDHYKVALETFGECLSRVHNIEDKHE